MSETTDLSELAKKRVSRRTFLMGVAGSAALGVFGISVAGCATSPSPTPTPTPGAPAAKAPAGSTPAAAPASGAAPNYAGRTLRVMLNGGFFEETVRGSIIASFEKKYGAKVETVPANSGEMLTRIRAEKASPTVDVCLIDDMVAVSGIGEGLFEKIDPNNIPNLKDLDKRAIDPQGYGPVVHTNPNVFAYNKDLVKVDPPKSWAELWDPRFKGMLGLSAINLTPGVTILLQAAMLNGGDYENIDPGFKALANLKPNVRKWFKDIGEVRPTVDQEPVIAAFGLNVWQDEISKGIPLVTINPKEGAHGISAMGQIVKGSKNKDLAELFINEYISPEGGAAISGKLYFKTFNTKTQLPDNVKNIMPTEVTLFDPFKIAKYREEWTARWLREIGG